jgi:hypothetical protein
VVNAAYWHPINLAGEAALLDLISDGRLEFGIGSGAYQREFDRMFPGLDQKDSWQYMQEMLPVVKKLWEGDYEHNGEYWQFPSRHVLPKPVQKEVPSGWQHVLQLPLTTRWRTTATSCLGRSQCRSPRLRNTASGWMPRLRSMVATIQASGR